MRIFRPPHFVKSSFVSMKIDACPPWISCQYASCWNHVKLFMLLPHIPGVAFLQNLIKWQKHRKSAVANRGIEIEVFKVEWFSVWLKIFDNWLKIPVDVGNLIETQYILSISWKIHVLRLLWYLFDIVNAYIRWIFPAKGLMGTEGSS